MSQLKKAIREEVYVICSLVKRTLSYIISVSTGLNLLLPYIFMYLVYKYGLDIMFFLLLPLIQITIAILTRYIDNKKYNGDVPIPNKRFTTNTVDDEIVVDRDRLNELILFMYQYEEWLEKNGKKLS